MKKDKEVLLIGCLTMLLLGVLWLGYVIFMGWILQVGLGLVGYEISISASIALVFILNIIASMFKR